MTFPSAWRLQSGGRRVQRQAFLMRPGHPSTVGPPQRRERRDTCPTCGRSDATSRAPTQGRRDAGTQGRGQASARPVTSSRPRSSLAGTGGRPLRTEPAGQSGRSCLCPVGRVDSAGGQCGRSPQPSCKWARRQDPRATRRPPALLTAPPPPQHPVWLHLATRGSQSLGLASSPGQRAPSLLTGRPHLGARALGSPSCGRPAPRPCPDGVPHPGECPSQDPGTRSAHAHAQAAPTPRADGVVHPRGAPVDHPLPLEGPPVDELQALLGPPADRDQLQRVAWSRAGLTRQQGPGLRAVHVQLEGRRARPNPERAKGTDRWLETRRDSLPSPGACRCVGKAGFGSPQPYLGLPS